MLRFRTLAACAAVGIAFCITAPAEAAGFNITDVWRADPVDLSAALTDAQAQGDTFAIQCYTGVAAYNAANPQRAFASDVVGVVSGFQAARDGLKAVNAGTENFIPPELIEACGPLALDAEHDIGHASLMLFGLKLL